MQATKTETTRFWIGQQPNPDDRRQIVVSLADAETIELSRRSRLHFAVTDLLTGHKLTLRRASCGAPRCMCALDIVREEKAHTLKITSYHDAAAECSCGGWHFQTVGPRTQEVQIRIEEEFQRHQLNALR